MVSFKLYLLSAEGRATFEKEFDECACSPDGLVTRDGMELSCLGCQGGCRARLPVQDLAAKKTELEGLGWTEL